ncbi:nucleotide-sugar transporter-domain-containing protein, partial [Spinellus fusiger]
VSIKLVSLLTLVVQNSALILAMRYTRASVKEDQRYLASTAVLMSEVLKTVICFAVLSYCQPHPRSLRRLMATLYSELILQWRQSAKLALPAILYLVQNNLQYMAATHLDAATFQVTYQLKIITTAFFSVTILHRTLSRRQWLALVLLTTGIALTVIPAHTSSSPTPTLGNQINLQGLISVLAACVLSGLAGVYFEKILKTPAKTVPPTREEEGRGHPYPNEKEKEEKEEEKHKQSYIDPLVSRNKLWIGNIQLSFFSVVLGLVFVVAPQDGAVIIEQGFFIHYTPWTWVVIVVQALGGLVVAIVVKYADSILKGFATSVSILLSSIVSIYLFDTTMTSVSVAGALLVIYSTYLYGLQS